MKTFEEWRQSDEAWEWPAGKGEPDLETMLRRAWHAGAKAERDSICKAVKPMLNELAANLMTSYADIRPITKQQNKTIIESLCDWL
jgi:hypothetical protein